MNTKRLISERNEFVKTEYKTNKCPTNSKVLRSMNKNSTSSLVNDRKEKLNLDIAKCGSWTGLKKVIPTRRTTSFENVPILDDLNRFNEFVASVGNCKNPEEFVSVSYQCQSPVSHFWKINMLYLMRVWSNVKNKSKSSADSMGICLRFLAEIIQCQNTVDVLVELFNKIIQEKTVPDCFKVSTITPLIKNRKLPATDRNNLRAIFVLPEITKIFERIIYNQLLSFLVTIKFF